MVIKELDYFTIDGCVGGNQEWLSDLFMHIGGCAAITACDCCIYLAAQKGFKDLYPHDANALTKSDFKKFTEIMKPYLRPRLTGINSLDIYISGLVNYMYDRNFDDISLAGFDGNKPLEQAKKIIIEQIDSGMPIPYLVLCHRDKDMADYVWHWFVITGYVESDDTFKVKATTYGESQWLSLDKLWDTGYKDKGGMIIMKSKMENNVNN